MANKRISQLTPGGTALVGDLLPIDRDGVNFSLTAASIAALAGGGNNGGPRPGLNNWRFAQVNNVNGFASGSMGMSMSAPYNHIKDATLTDTLYAVQATSSVFQVLYDQCQEMVLGNVVDAQWKCYTPTAAARYWIAMTSYPGPGAGWLYGDNPDVSIPGYSVIGFRFSPYAGDTHWQCYVSDIASNHTIVSSGIPIDYTTGHLFEIQQKVQGTILFLIDGVQVASINTNLPSLSTKYQMNSFMDNNSLSLAIEMGTSFMYWESGLK